MEFTLDGFTARGVTVRELMEEAFGIYEPDRISGEPPWVDRARLDITAKTDSSAAKELSELSLPQRRSMLERLLVQRFNLSIHHENRAVSVYVLSVAPKGPKLRQSTVHHDSRSEIRGYDNGLVRSSRYGLLEVEDMPIPAFAQILSHQLHKPVLDRTNLSGRFDISLHWTPEEPPTPRIGGDQSQAPAADTSWPPISAALREQLGLRLESAQAPVDTIVVDRVDQPSDN